MSSHARVIKDLRTLTVNLKRCSGPVTLKSDQMEALMRAVALAENGAVRDDAALMRAAMKKLARILNAAVADCSDSSSG